jgi:hypothetical protein
MGNGNTHRNKRGGRHTRNAPSRIVTTQASPGANGVAIAPDSPRPASAPASTAPSSASADALPVPAAKPEKPSHNAPSLRAPYAPGQRRERTPRPAVPAGEDRATEIEVTASTVTYETVVLMAHDSHHDSAAPRQASAPAGNDAARPSGAPAPADEDDYIPSRWHGEYRGALEERDADQSSPLAHQLPVTEREDDEGSLAGSPADEELDARDTAAHADVRGSVGPLIDDLRALFQRDRATASSAGGTRCGICYLHFTPAELEYRDDEGYYICADCAGALGTARVPMIRRQKRV